MIADDVTLGTGVEVTHPDLVNLYGCTVGDGTRIGPFVEIQRDVSIGSRCKLSSHSFICTGVTIGDEVFVGHGVMFINDKYPRSVGQSGELLTEGEWDQGETKVEDGASIGSNATVLGGLVVGRGAVIGAGAVVSRDVPPFAIVLGNPAIVVGDVRDRRDPDSHPNPQ